MNFEGVSGTAFYYSPNYYSKGELEMLLTKELKKTKFKTGKRAGKINYSQWVKVRCDECGKEYDVQYMLYLRRKEKRGSDLCQACAQIEDYRTGVRKSIFAEYNRKQKGKTLEERFGKEKAEETIQKQRESLMENPHYMTLNGESALRNKKRFAEMNRANRGKTYEERYGKERAKEIKKKIARKSSGKNNGSYNKIPSKKCGRGYKGYYKGHYFRSMIELSFMINFLEKNDIKFESGEKRRYTIPFVFNGVDRTYRCDYVTKDCAYEVKPFYMIEDKLNQAKFEAGEEFFKNLNKSFKVVTDRDFKMFTGEELLTMHDKGLIILSKSTLQRMEERIKC